MAKAFVARAIVYLFLFFPLFYLAYKFHTPDLGGNDYHHYHAIYLSPLDLGAAPEPWVLRQIQAVIVNALFSLGFDYPTEISFAKEGYERGIFFSALTVNYLSIVATAALLGIRLQRNAGKADTVSWVVPAFVTFNFSVVFFAFSGLTEGLSLLMFTMAYLAYRSGRFRLTAFVVLLACAQRELIALILLVLAAVDLIRGKQIHDRRGHLLVLATALLSLGANIAARLALASGDSSQISPTSVLTALTELSSVGTEFLFQVLLTQNLLIVTALVFLLFRIGSGRAPRIDKQVVVDVFLVFATIFLAGTAASVGNNIGRLLIFLSPGLILILCDIARDWAKLDDDPTTNP